LGFEKSQRSVTHDSLRYINILTYLLTYIFDYLAPVRGLLLVYRRCVAAGANVSEQFSQIWLDVIG